MDRAHPDPACVAGGPDHPVLVLAARAGRGGEECADPAGYPHFVDRAMLDAVGLTADGQVECVTDEGLPQDLTVGGEIVRLPCIQYRPKK